MRERAIGDEVKTGWGGCRGSRLLNSHNEEERKCPMKRYRTITKKKRRTGRTISIQMYLSISYVTKCGGDH